MEMLEYFRRQFAYDDWANRKVLDALMVSGHANPRAVQLLAHILSAERLWLQRIRMQPQSLPVWPESSPDQCEKQIGELASLWRDFLAELTPARLSERITYKNTKGEEWSSVVEDVLTHVVLHSSYHRGQIATQMRAAGEQPAYTDFIHAVRQGLIESSE